MPGTQVYSVMDFARYFTYASWDLRDALDLWIFSLKYPEGDPRRKGGQNGLYLNGLNNKELLRKVRQGALDGAKASLLRVKQTGRRLGRLPKALRRSVTKECLN